MTPTTNPPEPMPTENKTAEQGKYHIPSDWIEKRAHLEDGCEIGAGSETPEYKLAVILQILGASEGCDHVAAVSHLRQRANEMVAEIKALTQSTAAQSSELDSWRKTFSELFGHQSVICPESLANCVQHLESKLSHQSLEIERLRKRHAHVHDLCFKLAREKTALQGKVREMRVFIECNTWYAIDGQRYCVGCNMAMHNPEGHANTCPIPKLLSSSQQVSEREKPENPVK